MSGEAMNYAPAGGSALEPVSPAPIQPYPQPVTPVAKTNGLAIASLVLGIVWLMGLGSLLAVIFGHVSLRQVSLTGEQGRGMAIAGLVLGYIGLGFWALVIFIGILGAAAGA